MTPRFSLYLDLLRFLAAMLVLVSHFAYPRFTGGDYIVVRDFNLGSDAVVFFFVLSGLVIAYTTEVKDKTFGMFAFHRLTRLYSVIVPALFLGIALDTWGNYIAPESYAGWWYNGSPIGEQLWRGLTLSNEWANQHFRLGTNGPLWSLSYEAAYYVLFGVAFYISGYKKYLFLFPLMFLFGVAILFLFPAWLMGVWAYQKIKSNALPESVVRAFIIAPPLIYILFLNADISKILFVLTFLVTGEDFIISVLGFSNDFIWNFIISILIACHLIGVAAVFQKQSKSLPEKLSKFIRWCAGATFTIYVVHYPLLQFMDVVLPETLDTPVRHVMLFVSVLILCFLFAELSERRLKWLRIKLIEKPMR